MIVILNRYQINFKFEGFKFLKFSFEQTDSIFDGEDFEFQLATNIEGSGPVKAETSHIIVKVIVLVRRKSLNKIVSNIETASLFRVEGIGKFVDKEGKVKYPETILSHLVSLAISTTRGAILAKGAGSFLENMPLPIVDPKNFFPVRNDQDPNETHQEIH